jgi:hypothetical protein
MTERNFTQIWQDSGTVKIDVSGQRNKNLKKNLKNLLQAEKEERKFYCGTVR